MFVQNQGDISSSHKDIIIAEIERAGELLFVVAYVRENGVDMILENIKNKPAKLLCSLDMGITQLSGIKKLLENGVEVKFYKSNEGTFHPKIWLFGNNGSHWKMLIGSANLTRAALTHNVEASVLVEEETVTSSAVEFFKYLWNRENSIGLTIDEVNSLQDNINKRKNLQHQTARIEIENDDDPQKIEGLFNYTKTWIDIPKYESKGISSLWRGWYIIPDHGYINDEKITHLKSYLPFIENRIHQSDEAYGRLLEQFVENSNFQRRILVNSAHRLFVRQAKNYLIKLGWCYHPIKDNGKPDKQTLCLTDLGEQINQCQNLDDVRILYTEYFLNYSFNGLSIVKFTKRLLQILDSLTLEEFNYFVIHAYSDDDFDNIVNLIRIYRSLSSNDTFHATFRDYFEQEKGRTAQNVYGNYFKNIKYTISVIGWCDGFSVDTDFTLKLNNENE